MTFFMEMGAIGLLLLSGTQGPDNEAVKDGAKRAIRLIEASVKEYPKHRDCFSCHHQAVPTFALVQARDRGFVVDREALLAQLELTRDDLASSANDYRAGKGQPGGVTRAGYALWTLDVVKCEPDETTAAVAGFLLGRDRDRGGWSVSGRRPPTEASDFTATYLGLASLAAFGEKLPAVSRTARVDKARDWLLNTQPKDTEDRVFRLLGLQLSKADPSAIAWAAAQLIATQKADGGWSQLDGGQSDAYATGSALTALHMAGGMKTDVSIYRRGLDYLIKTQAADGSWHVRSRSTPFQPYFESGFPYKKDQFISIAATGWATSALVFAVKQELSCPPPPNSTGR